MDRQLTVIVSGLQAATSPAPGYETVRCLADMPATRLVGIDYDPLCTGLFSDMAFQHVCHLPSPVHWRAFSASFCKLCTTQDASIFIPCTDLDVALLSAHESEVSSWGLHMLIPGNSSITQVSKLSLAGTSGQIDIGFFVLPKSVILDSESNIAWFDSMSYPLCLKGRLSGVIPVPNPSAAKVQARNLARTTGWPIIAQEWIAGDEYSVMGLASKTHELLGWATIKKLGLSESGSTWAGVTVDLPDFAQVLERIIALWNWSGPIEMDLIRSASGHFYLLDVNIRFPSWVAVARDAGLNLPTMLVEHLSGLPVHFGSAKSGLAFAQVAEDKTLPIGTWLEKTQGVTDDYDGFYRNL